MILYPPQTVALKDDDFQTEYPSFDTASRAPKRGAHDYITKAVDPDEPGIREGEK